MFSKLFLVLSLALYCGVFLAHATNPTILGDGLKTEESSANGYGSNADGYGYGYGYGYSERALKKGKKEKKSKKKKGKKEKKSKKSKGPASKITYKAAVAETSTDHHYFDYAQMVYHLKAARSQNAQMIVFPEAAPAFNRTNFNNVLYQAVDVPAPSDIDISEQCGNIYNMYASKASYPVYNGATAVIPSIGCVASLAKQYGMYIALNVVDKKPCITDTASVELYMQGENGFNVTNMCLRNLPENTPPSYLFNTLVHFGPDGSIVAKYYKRMLFGTDGNKMNADDHSLTPSREPFRQHFKENGTFTTDFGVTFASAICNDLNDDQYMLELHNQGIKNLIYANNYENAMDTLTIGTQLQGVSKFYGLTIIAASTGYFGASGSGIYQKGTLLTSQPDNTNNQCAMSVPGQDSFGDSNLIPFLYFPQRACEGTYSAEVTYDEMSPASGVKKNLIPVVMAGDKSWISLKGVQPSLAIGVPKLVDGLFENFGQGNFGPGFTYDKNEAELSATIDAIVQNANSVILAVPTNRMTEGIYTAHVKSPLGDTTCTVSATFPAGPDETNAYYILKAFDSTNNQGGIWKNTNCPIDIAGCSFARCFWSAGVGQCVTIPELYPTIPPFASVEISSVTLTADFDGSKIVYPMVTDNNLQPVKSLSTVSMSGPLHISDWLDTSTSPPTFVPLNRTKVTMTTSFESSFLSFVGFDPFFKNPQDCNVCSNPNDIYDYEGARVQEPLRGSLCSNYNSSYA
ncbi:hypothetical protein TrST_g10276 [Triparma strigata]|uniref:CN hydrolase domain-containing protein n=1 Tax=Triparma strigata TaxID=1606541 RepID=A0A9W6ZQS8_9STRA|nr:hypothetical protein TrST_g10276 [Triparma strigata]